MNSRRDELAAVGEWAGIEVPAAALGLLDRYENWLQVEGIPAGGVGPNEADRLWSRHILDSCLFTAFTAGYDDVVDIGSGVGLPGIPLAVMCPELRVTLLDKSQRRTDLASRAVRLLQLDNANAINATIESYRGTHDIAVSRAALPLGDLQAAARRVGAKRVVVSGSRVAPPSVPPGWELVEVPERLLGEKAWMMEAWISVGESG